ncbi:hypothetical protein EZJ49_12510 [Bdellovibrio bacteriovorus]|uniref:hypothetical protein n=1 Tax=Bdellovibrio bacteriovorus TaxID=959 RepID=UPI0021CF89B3|nr:hypothetical protein [Bdellovibrio bacteriovorus]UXR63886.1 hypothetical protein EZJ49_12510 [Bdellovibrio bacteriovorus]
MKKQLVVYSTALALFMSACAPTEKGAHTAGPKKQNLNQYSGWEQFQKLIYSENANLPLAEALRSLLQEQNPEVLGLLRAQLEQGKALAFPEEISQRWDMAKKSIIVGDSGALADTDLLLNTLNLNLDEVQRSNAFHHQLEGKMAGLVQSVALRNLLQTFNEQIKKDSRDIAVDVVVKIKRNHPEVLDKIDKTKAIGDRSAQIEQIVTYLKQADYLFYQYGFSEDDQARLALYTAVAGAMASVLTESATVKVLLANVQQIRDVAEKAKKVVALAEALGKYSQSLKDDAVVMGGSVKNIYGKIKNLTDSIELSLSDSGKMQAREMMDDLLNGRAATIPSPEVASELEKTGFFQRKRELDSDVQKFVNSAENASKSLDNILKTTMQVTDVLGIKLDPGVTKAIDTAMKINQGIQAVSAISKAFSAGGFVGALGAFSGGPATMALAAFGGLGGGGPDPAIMAELAAIKQSLAEIKAMQKEILENQKKMMVMIKDLALMMEEYHREQMMLIMDTREEVLNNRSALTEIDEKSFRSCEAMTTFALSKAPSYRASAKSSLSISNMDLVQGIIRDVTTSRKELMQFINNGSSENFKTCQQEMSTVFMTRDFRKFSRAAWTDEKTSGEEAKDGGQIVKRYYAPAFSYLQEVTVDKEARWKKLGLHLPVLNVSALVSKKSRYVDQPGKISNLMELQNLTATNKLEKYVTALLVLHPYLTVDYEDWNSSLQDVLSAAVTEQTRERTRQLLSNAFERVQMAVAQEALLAGEPLLPNLSLHWAELVKEKSQCGKDHEKFCFVRENSLMMRNLLTYVLVQRTGVIPNTVEASRKRQEIYQQWLNDPAVLAQVLMVPKEAIVKDEKGRLNLVLAKGDALNIALPEAEEVATGHLQYTEAMSRMIQLQHRVADELAKISSLGYTSQEQEKLAKAMFLK